MEEGRDDEFHQDAQWIDRHDEWARQMMATNGWFAHFVTSVSDDVPLLNAHTHGLRATFGHLDLQIVAWVAPEVAHGVFWSAVGRIRNGEAFAKDQVAERVIERFRVKFVAATESGRSVLRLLLPDERGTLPGEHGCEPKWDRQLTAKT